MAGNCLRKFGWYLKSSLHGHPRAHLGSGRFPILIQRKKKYYLEHTDKFLDVWTIPSIELQKSGIEGPSWAHLARGRFPTLIQRKKKILLRTYRQVSWCLDNTVNRVAKKRQMIVIKRKHKIILNDSRRFILLQKERASFLVFRNE